MNVQAENLGKDVLLSDRLEFVKSQFLSGGLKLYLMNIEHLSVCIPLLLSFAKFIKEIEGTNQFNPPRSSTKRSHPVCIPAYGHSLSFQYLKRNL